MSRSLSLKVAIACFESESDPLAAARRYSDAYALIHPVGCTAGAVGLITVAVSDPRCETLRFALSLPPTIRHRLVRAVTYRCHRRPLGNPFDCRRR